jgi:hypothetical protein
MVTVRSVRNKEDCEAVVNLTAEMFPEEAQATGLPLSKWRDLRTEELLREPCLWPQCGQWFRSAPWVTCVYNFPRVQE